MDCISVDRCGEVVTPRRFVLSVEVSDIVCVRVERTPPLSTGGDRENKERYTLRPRSRAMGTFIATRNSRQRMRTDNIKPCGCWRAAVATRGVDRMHDLIDDTINESLIPFSCYVFRFIDRVCCCFFLAG